MLQNQNSSSTMVLPPPPPPPLHSSQSNFPVTAIALIGILATAFLLLGYYIFFIKCCFHSHQFNIFTRLTTHNTTPPTTLLSPLDIKNQLKGLDEAVIRSIPLIKFRKITKNRGNNHTPKEEDSSSSYECSVCLNEFNDGERLRVIPNCCHAFHIDCIDVWLQNNANCPLCRSAVTPSSVFLYNQENTKNPDGFSANDDDFVVIEIQGNNLDEPRFVRKLEHVSSLGDEWIDIRKKNEEFDVMQPIRRSISMDFCLEFQQCSGGETEVSCGNSVGNCSRKVKRSIFSGYGVNINSDS